MILRQQIYPVREAAALLGVSDKRVLQLIAAYQTDRFVPEGLYLRTATEAERREAGVNPDVITRPRHWIPASEIRRVALLRRNRNRDK